MQSVDEDDFMRFIEEADEAQEKLDESKADWIEPQYPELRTPMNNRCAVPEWNEEAYRKAIAAAKRLTDKGCRIALNGTLTHEAREAYKDVLRSRGWSDFDLLQMFPTEN